MNKPGLSTGRAFSSSPKRSPARGSNGASLILRVRRGGATAVQDLFNTHRRFWFLASQTSARRAALLRISNSRHRRYSGSTGNRFRLFARDGVTTNNHRTRGCWATALLPQLWVPLSWLPLPSAAIWTVPACVSRIRSRCALPVLPAVLCALLLTSPRLARALADDARYEEATPALRTCSQYLRERSAHSRPDR